MLVNCGEKVAKNQKKLEKELVTIDDEVIEVVKQSYIEEIENKLDGVEAKYHLNRFTKRFNLNNYIWVMEFQKTGIHTFIS